MYRGKCKKLKVGYTTKVCKKYMWGYTMSVYNAFVLVHT